MLYIVSTPIGNLKDITLRGLEVLKSVDLIACEDTRQSSKLMAYYDIRKPLLSYHSYNKAQRGDKIIQELLSGKSVALISDSGTPGISDPGSQLVSDAIKAGVDISVIPGPSAALAGLSGSGFPTEHFYFAGFLSSKPTRRKNQLQHLKTLEATLVVYEAPHRLIKLLNDILETCGDIDICICRELTKKFEETRREKTSLALKHFSDVRPRGEFVIIFNPLFRP